MQVLTHFPLLKALGWALFDSLWQMAALWLLHGLLMAIFRSAEARIRHSLALCALGIGAVWSGLTFIAAVFFPQGSTNTWLALLSPNSSVPAWFWSSCGTFMDAALPYASTIYLLVLTGLAIRYSRHYRHTRRLTHNGLSMMPPEFRVFASSTALQLGIRKPVQTWLSSRIDIPVTLGFLKPVILLPVAMLNQLSAQQVEAILIHELGHIRRKDYLLHLVVTVLEGLFFFNPFTRLLIRQLKKEREHCCDDLVLQFKYDPHAYVSALLSLAALHQPIRELAVAATGSQDKWLLERARRILSQQKENRIRPKTRSLILLLLAALATSVTLYRPPHGTGRLERPVAIRQVTRQAEQRSGARPPVDRTVPSAPASQETALNHPMHSIAPGVTVTRRRSSGQRDVATNRRKEPSVVDDNEDMVTTLDNPMNSSDENPMTLVASADDISDPSDATANNNRDFSLNTPMAIASGPAITLQQCAPMVPNSSFLYQYTLGDSSRLLEQQVYLQLSAQREVLAAIANLQQQTAAQLKALTNLRTKATESVGLRNRIRDQQQKIQLDYLRKIKLWQQKLEKAPHIKVIVYI